MSALNPVCHRFLQRKEKQMIYFDNAATTMMKPDCVIRAVTQAMTSLGNAGRGAHKATLDASRLIYETRKKLAGLFHVKDPSRIAFTANGTESLNIAIKGILRKGCHVITTSAEHNSVLRPLYEMEAEGVELTILSCDSKGYVRPEQFAQAIRPATRAIICTHGSNLTGNLMDIRRIGETARRRQLLFCVDAAQTAGMFPIDVEDMNIDILCFTGHKALHGPQGTGGIYVGERACVRPLKTGGSGILTYSRTHPDRMPEALEAGTLNGHGLAGLHAALDYLRETGMDIIRKQAMELMWQFYHGVREIPDIRIYGDFDTTDRCPVVSLNLGTYDSASVSDELYLSYGIATRPGGHCAPLMHRALGTREQGAVRFSFSHFNTEQEVEAAVKALWEMYLPE